MTKHIHQVAAAGNAAALLMVIFVAVVLTDVSNPPQRISPWVTETSVDGLRPERVVLIVVDALRDDVARDPHIMPTVCKLASHGVRTTASSEAVIPSSVAGITTLATGIVPGPSSFLHDFRSPPAAHGGVFERLAQRSERSFVSGPSLWAELFGRWTSVEYAASPLIESDDQVLQAGLAALNDASYRLAVFHFCRADEAAHLKGAKSAEYLAAVQKCDEAIRQILLNASPDTVVIITSDHGVTDSGGHAGPEPDVLTTPLVISGTGASETLHAVPPLKQRDIPEIIAGMLELESPSALASAVHTVTHEYRPLEGNLVRGLVIIGMVCAILILAALVTGQSDGRPHAFWLNLTLWFVIALLLAGYVFWASLLASSMLVGVRGHSNLEGLAVRQDMRSLQFVWP